MCLPLPANTAAATDAREVPPGPVTYYGNTGGTYVWGADANDYNT